VLPTARACRCGAIPSRPVGNPYINAISGFLKYQSTNCVSMVIFDPCQLAHFVQTLLRSAGAFCRHIFGSSHVAVIVTAGAAARGRCRPSLAVSSPSLCLRPLSPGAHARGRAQPSSVALSAAIVWWCVMSRCSGVTDTRPSRTASRSVRWAGVSTSRP